LGPDAVDDPLDDDLLDDPPDLAADPLDAAADLLASPDLFASPDLPESPDELLEAATSEEGLAESEPTSASLFFFDSRLSVR
jgi:hypothetical protein